MTKFLSLCLIASLFSCPLLAANKYFTHHKIESSGGPLGDWSIDYIQLVPLKGQQLTPQQKAVNATLKAFAEDAVPQAGDQDYGTSSVKIRSNVTFVSPRLLAVDVRYDSYYAGAAHPNYGLSSAIYDLKIGKEIAISSGLPLGQYGEKFETEEFKAFITKKMISAAKLDAGLYADCKELYNENDLKFPNVSLSPKAITVSPSFPHAAKTCEVSARIPLKDLKAIAQPGSLLEELVKGAK